MATMTTSPMGGYGRIRWCWLERGEAAVMLQEFLPGRQPKETLGTGVNVCFQCEDALALYREFKSRGIQTRERPSVGNRLWVVSVTDPDGYRMEFSSPTDAPEDRTGGVACLANCCEQANALIDRTAGGRSAIRKLSLRAEGRLKRV